jgi:hypothetical protein
MIVNIYEKESTKTYLHGQLILMHALCEAELVPQY